MLGAGSLLFGVGFFGIPHQSNYPVALSLHWSAPALPCRRFFLASSRSVSFAESASVCLVSLERAISSNNSRIRSSSLVTSVYLLPGDGALGGTGVPHVFGKYSHSALIDDAAQRGSKWYYPSAPLAVRWRAYESPVADRESEEM